MRRLILGLAALALTGCSLFLAWQLAGRPAARASPGAVPLAGEAPYRPLYIREMWAFYPDRAVGSVAGEMECLREEKAFLSVSTIPIWQGDRPAEVTTEGPVEVSFDYQPYGRDPRCQYLIPLVGPRRTPKKGETFQYLMSFRLPAVPFLHHEPGDRRMFSLTYEAGPERLESQLFLAIPSNSTDQNPTDLQPTAVLDFEGWTVYQYDTTLTSGRVAIHLGFVMGSPEEPAPTLPQVLARTLR